MKEIRNLAVRLTPEELHQRAMRLAELASTKLAAEDALSHHKKLEYRKIKGMAEEMKLLTDIVTKGTEVRDVACTRRFNEKANRIDIVRDDTGEVVDSEAITDMDRQKDAFAEVVDMPERGTGSSKRPRKAPGKNGEANA